MEAFCLSVVNISNNYLLRKTSEAWWCFLYLDSTDYKRYGNEINIKKKRRYFFLYVGWTMKNVIIHKSYSFPV